MKRILSVLLAILMLAGVAPAAVAEDAHEITMKETPMYISIAEVKYNVPLLKNLMNAVFAIAPPTWYFESR